MLKAHVLLEAARASRDIGDDGMIDHQIARDLGLISFGSPSQLRTRLAHHREVDENGNAREILKQNARRRKLDLFAGLSRQTRRDDALGEKTSGFRESALRSTFSSRTFSAKRQLLGSGNRAHRIIRVASAPASRRAAKEVSMLLLFSLGALGASRNDQFIVPLTKPANVTPS